MNINCVSRQLSDLCQYYVLQHHIYLKEDIFKLTENTTMLAISGLQLDELTARKYVNFNTMKENEITLSRLFLTTLRLVSVLNGGL
jgi:hypothetical protein